MAEWDVGKEEIYCTLITIFDREKSLIDSTCIKDLNILGFYVIVIRI